MLKDNENNEIVIELEERQHMKQICSFCWDLFQPEMLLQMVWKKNILAQPDFRGIAGSVSSVQEEMHSLLGGGLWGIWHFAHASELNGNFTKGTDLQVLHRADEEPCMILHLSL